MSEETRYLTFALGKGRLANKTLELLEEIGITCEEMKDKESRKLIFVNEEQKLKFFLAKGPDVPTYVEYGAADIGVVGKILCWRNSAELMKYWISALESAECVSAVRRVRKNFCNTTK